MQFTKLGDSDLKASRIGFGCWAIGGTDWGPVEDGESIRAIRRALDLGINFFDTADVYGVGHSEEVLGRALGKERKRVLVATKVGGVKREGEAARHDTSRRHILEAIDQSLARLNTDYVDLYQIHVPDASTPVSETMSTLTELVKKGKVRYVGLSNMGVEQVSEYMKHGTVTTIQPGYSMIERQEEKELFPFCLANNISVLAYSPLGRSLLTGKYNRESRFSPGDVRAVDPEFQGKIFEMNLECVERLRPLAAAAERSLAQLAIAWALSHPAVSVALVGAKNPAQVEENATAFERPLPPEVFSEANRILDETESKKKSYRENTIASLKSESVERIESKDAGRELVDGIILWLMELHGRYGVGADRLGPLFAAALKLRGGSTLGQEKCIEELRQRLADIHEAVEKPETDKGQ